MYCAAKSKEKKRLVNDSEDYLTLCSHTKPFFCYKFVRPSTELSIKAGGRGF